MKNVHRFLMCSCFALALVPLSAAAETALVYITNSAGDSVHVIDPMTNKVVQTIRNVEGAHGVTFSPDGSRVYISSELTETLDVYDQKTRRADQEGEAVEPSEQYRGGEGRTHPGRHLARRRRGRHHRSREAGSHQDDSRQGTRAQHLHDARQQVPRRGLGRELVFHGDRSTRRTRSPGNTITT